MKTYPYIITPSADSPLTLQQARQWLALDIPGFDGEDDKIHDLIRSACAWAERYAGIKLLPTAYEWVCDGLPCQIPGIRLITEITSIECHNGEEYVALEPGTHYRTYRQGQERMVIEYVAGASLPALPRRGDAVRVRFTAGFAENEVPQDVVQAIRARLREDFDLPGDRVSEKKTLSERILDLYRETYAG